MSDEKTLTTTVSVPKGEPVDVAKIWGTAIGELKEAGKVPQDCVPWAEINVKKTEADKSGKKDERVYHVDVHYRALTEGETATADQVIASMLTPPTFDPDEEKDDNA
jgi:hypothetical protein